MKALGDTAFRVERHETLFNGEFTLTLQKKHRIVIKTKQTPSKTTQKPPFGFNSTLLKTKKKISFFQKQKEQKTLKLRLVAKKMSS